MDKLNDKALAAAFGVLWPAQEWNGEEGMCLSVTETAIRAYLSALPAPDDGLEVVRGLLDNGQDLVRLSGAQAIIRSRDETIARLERERDSETAEAAHWHKEAQDNLTRAEAAEARLSRAMEVVRQIERRTAHHPDDTAADDTRDKMHANALAREFLEGGE
ncbi:MAG: hypothetical protein ABS76_07485 [Pelagibacterium sp. SCN 64-44]|nr:MAG: hypothetical protein ABS76_07485 [Pelagibacterium sp. SCN 64-44]